MQNQYDSKKCAILYVDDEEMAVKYFEKSYAGEFRFFTASNAADGLKILEEHGDEIAILISDQRMPGEKGVQLLERARILRPRMVRMLITAYADFSVTVDAVNLGSIFRYLSKPIQVEDVRTTLHRAMDFFILQQERDNLLQEKLSTLQNLLITDRIMALGVVSAGLSHTYSNALSALAAFLNLTPRRLQQQNLNLTKLSNPTFWHDFHAQVVKQSSNIADLISSLPQVPENQEELSTETALQAVIASQKPDFAEKNIELKWEQSGPLPTIHSKSQALHQMLTLLMKAELDLVPSGGTIAITAKTSVGALQLTFNASGNGFSPELLGKIFDPFMIQLEPMCTGALNLMGAYFLTYDLGGTISTQRGSGGQTFVINIPTSPQTPAKGPESGREFITNVLMNDTLWERLLPNG